MSAQQEPRAPLVIAVVGHTNTGKTSLIRTLLRNSEFGQVQDSAGTTRHVEAAQLAINGQAMIELRDTPGLEDSIALQSLLQTLEAAGFSGRRCLQQLIDEEHQHVEFEQEIKVLKQAMTCDALLYVVDCRDDVFEKYRHEIQSLSLASRPILPVLNFVHTKDSQVDLWRDALAELRLHALVEFDTVAFDFTAENRLYQKLQTLLEPSYDLLQSLLEHRAVQWQQVRSACETEVAKLMLNVAGKINITDHQEDAEKQLMELRDFTREQEQDCLKSLLNILEFSDLAVDFPDLPVSNGRWTIDLFAPETLKAFGLDTASAAATGAAIGAGVDLLLAGLSLGTGTLAGAAIGATWQTGRRYGRNLLTKLKGQSTACVDDTTLTLLLLRQIWLLRTLFGRGHAAQESLHLESTEKMQAPPSWPEQLKQLHLFRNANRSERQRLQHKHEQQLATWLQQQI